MLDFKGIFGAIMREGICYDLRSRVDAKACFSTIVRCTCLHHTQETILLFLLLIAELYDKGKIKTIIGSVDFWALLQLQLTMNSQFFMWWLKIVLDGVK